mgnify:CR=1 FL=1
MNDEFVIYTGDILSELTKYVEKTTDSIEMTKNFSINTKSF